MEVADLRDAKWLDPHCAESGRCQSLRFKEVPPPLSEDKICAILDGVRAQWVRPPIESIAVAFARAIEQAHGIGLRHQRGKA